MTMKYTHGLEVIQVIHTNLSRRGNGTDKHPFRRVEQYWSMDGELLWEIDPCPDKDEEGE